MTHYDISNEYQDGTIGVESSSNDVNDCCVIMSTDTVLLSEKTVY